MEFALPDLAGFAAACLLIVLACAIALLAALLANTLGRLPVVGSWVTQNMVGALTDAANAVMSAADATWHFAIGMFNFLYDIWTKPFIYTVKFATAAYNWTDHLFSVTIPAAENRALVYAAGLVTTAESDAKTLFSAAEIYARSAASAVETRAEALFTESEQYAQGIVVTAEQALSRDIAEAETAAAAGLLSAERALTAGIGDVASAATSDLQYLAQQVNSALGRLASDVLTETGAAEAIAAANLAAVRSGIYTDLETWGSQAVADAWPDAPEDIAALRKVLGGDFPWLNDLLGVLGGAGALGLLGALVRSMAAANVVTNLATDCIIPNCRNLSGLGNDLSELLSAASLAAMLAWLIFCVTDPVAAVQDMDDVALQPLSDLASAASHLFGGP